MIKTNEKGITIMSLIIYIIVMLIVIMILATLNNTYRSGVMEMRKDSTLDTEYNKFNIYFLEEVKKTNNEVVSTYSLDGNTENLYTVGETVTADKIKFNTNYIFSWEDPDTDGIYSIYRVNGDEKFEVAYNIGKSETTSIFTVSQADSGNTKITVTVSIDGEEKVIEYVLSNKQISTTENEEDFSNNEVLIPDGFYYVGGVKDYGVVISDNQADENKYKYFVDVPQEDLVGNQFVWVPVENVNDMYGTDSNGNKLGKLYSGTIINEEIKMTSNNWTEINGVMSWKFDETSNFSFREPDIIKSSTTNNPDAIYENISQALTVEELNGITNDSSSEDIANHFKTILQTEFNNMIDSVSKYGGFFVGRYETSNLGLTDSTKVKVIPRTNSGINNKTWYTMYKNSKTLSTDSVTSGMIYGCQWSQIMKWTEYYATRESNTYSSKPETTGNVYLDGITYDKTHNIYDLASNLTEWSQEVYYNNSRVSHGSHYNAGGYSLTNFGIIPTDSNSTRGSRVTFYVK